MLDIVCWGIIGLGVVLVILVFIFWRRGGFKL